jgi:O-methyltransferase involved in polyketide biosynthesis
VSGGRHATGKDFSEPLNIFVPHPARLWNYWLGGKDNFAIDREVGERVRAVHPAIIDVAHAARAFLVRAVTYLATDAGIRQFVDIGTGLPTAENTHEVAQRVAPHCHIVYVDNDPMVLAHARALLTSGPEGATDYIDADMHDVDKILHEAARTLNFSQPIALMLLGVLGYAEYGQARAIVKQLLDAVPSGSYLLIGDGIKTTEGSEAGVRVANAAGIMYRLRTLKQIVSFFDGLELVEPGIVPATQWLPEAGYVPGTGAEQAICGVGRKP